jgi:hypothetical protein
MKHFLTTVIACAFGLACGSPGPEKTLVNFVKDVHAGRIDAASKALDAATVQRLGPGRAREALVDAYDGWKSEKLTPRVINQTVQGDVATVTMRLVGEKDSSTLDIKLFREDGTWKVDMPPPFGESLQREETAATEQISSRMRGEMKSVLRNLSAWEDEYAKDHGGRFYGGDPAGLRFTVPARMSLQISATPDQRAYTATVTNDLTPEKCILTLGAARNPSGEASSRGEILSRLIEINSRIKCK